MGLLRYFAIVGTLALVLMGGAAASQPYPALRDRYDPLLQAQLESVLKRLKLAGAVDLRQLGLALVDITDLERPRVAAVNGDEMFYAASLPKIAILLGAFVQIEQGKLALDDDTRDALTRMIRVSSNRDATRMLHRVGKANLAKLLQSERFRLYDPDANGGLWVGKDYGKASAWKRDPLYNISHGATAMQAARFYYLLETNRLVSKPLTAQMKSMLAEPAIKHKFVKGLQGRRDTRLYRKSGTWKRWHADSAIVEHRRSKYIIVGLAENPRGGDWLSRLIGPIDDIIGRSHQVAAAGEHAR